jgi:hypothetical protein
MKINKEWIETMAFDRISALAAEYIQAIGGKEK